VFFFLIFFFPFLHHRKYLEHIAKGKTSEAISRLIELTPRTATRLTGWTPAIGLSTSADLTETQVAVEALLAGEIVRVVAGERIPVDGVILMGATSVDESMLTGESVPAYKQQEDEVLAGTINLSGTIIISAEKVSSSVISQLVPLVLFLFL
jgi:Cu+-exporting ATPase